MVHDSRPSYDRREDSSQDSRLLCGDQAFPWMGNYMKLGIKQVTNSSPLTIAMD